MSRGDLTIVEDRLRRTLHDVAATVPGAPPTALPPRFVLRSFPSSEEPDNRVATGTGNGRRRVAALVAAAAVTLAFLAGSVALLTTDRGAQTVRVGSGAGTDTATTAAAPQSDGLVDVPDVVGTTQADAGATLERAGFSVRVDHASGASGVVVAEEPSNRRAAPGAVITLAVGSG